MHWLAAVLIGHLFNAVAFVVDKILLTKSFQNPFVYAFFIGALSGLAVVLIPFGVEWPGWSLFSLDVAGGALFIASLVCFFYALQGAEASRIVPFIGGGIPVFTLVFEILFLDQQLSRAQLTAFAVLVVGTVLIAIEIGTPEGAVVEQKQKQGARAWVYGLAAAVLFATSFGLTKMAYDAQPFLSAFTLQRFGSVAFALLFLLSAKNRAAIVQAIPLLKQKTGLVFLGSQSLGAGGFVFINYAISLASVSIVNALQGVQYAFLLVLGVIGTLKYPKLLKESMSTQSLIIKCIAVVVIGVGLYLIAQTA